MTNTVISIVREGTIKPTVRVRLGVRSALLALLCATTLGMAQEGAGRPDNLGLAPQAHVEPHTITLPVVDGHDLSFTRLSTDDGLSQAKASYVVQDDQGFMWFATQDGLNRYDGYSFKLFVHDPENPNSGYVRFL